MHRYISLWSSPQWMDCSYLYWTSDLYSSAALTTIVCLYRNLNHIKSVLFGFSSIKNISVIQTVSFWMCIINLFLCSLAWATGICSASADWLEQPCLTLQLLPSGYCANSICESVRSSFLDESSYWLSSWFNPPSNYSPKTFRMFKKSNCSFTGLALHFSQVHNLPHYNER